LQQNRILAMLGDLASRRDPLSTSLSRGRAILVDALLVLDLVIQGLLWARSMTSGCATLAPGRPEMPGPVC